MAIKDTMKNKPTQNKTMKQNYELVGQTGDEKVLKWWAIKKQKYSQWKKRKDYHYILNKLISNV